MKTRMVEQREGELLGPVDWNYDFDQHGINPKYVEQGKNNLKIIEDGLSKGKKFRVGYCGINHKVISVGMYDGWPFWRPTPSVLLNTWMGGEWHPFYDIQNVEEVNG